MSNITYSLPLSGWRVSSKKTLSLSMNVYRNLHYQTNNKLKHMVSDYLLKYKFPKYKQVKINYTLYFKDKRHRDLMNFVAVADKCILDHLVNTGSLIDDNYNYVTGYTIAFGGLADENKIAFNIREINS